MYIYIYIYYDISYCKSSAVRPVKSTLVISCRLLSNFSILIHNFSQIIDLTESDTLLCQGGNNRKQCFFWASQ